MGYGLAQDHVPNTLNVQEVMAGVIYYTDGLNLPAQPAEGPVVRTWPAPIGNGTCNGSFESLTI